MLTATDANTHRFVRNVYDANGRVFEQYGTLDNKWSFAYDEPAHKTLNFSRTARPCHHLPVRR